MLHRHFQFSKYEDAPELSDQLLLPNLAIGNNIFLISSFVPSYIQRVVRDLASSPEIEPGHLSVTFYVPGNLVRESEGVRRFRDYLIKGCGSSAGAAAFTDDCLQLLDEGGLSIQIAHGPGRKGTGKGAFGVFTDPNSDDYVAIEDAKGGDYNSPVRPKKSWIPEEVSSAEKILWRVNRVLEASQENSYLVSWRDAARWLSLIGRSFEENPASTDAAKAGTEPELSEEDWLEDNYFADLVEDAESYGWSEEHDLDELVEFFSAGYSVSVSESEIDLHHVPPMPDVVANLVGLAQAECACGRKFNRIYGCPAIAW